MPIAILYYKVSPESINSAQQSAQIAGWIEELPIIKQNQLKKLRREKDRLLSLAGLQLLKIAMLKYPNYPFSLKQLHYPKQGKPFFKGNIDFNISHSGDFVCCVVSDTLKVGIDVERHRQVHMATLNKFLPDSTNFNSKHENHQQFFNIWTKNEAIIKAANNGSLYNMKDIKLKDNGGHYLNKFWSTYPVEIISADNNNEYTCHIACSEKIATNEIIKTQIHNL